MAMRRIPSVTLSVQVERLEEFFAGRQEVVLAYLFGSAARDSHAHDVDIGVWMREPYSFEKTQRLWSDLEKLLRKDIDLIIMNEAGPSISWAAMCGRPLLVRDEAFELESMLEISDEAEYMRDFTIDLAKWQRLVYASREAGR